MTKERYVSIPRKHDNKLYGFTTKQAAEDFFEQKVKHFAKKHILYKYGKKMYLGDTNRYLEYYF